MNNINVLPIFNQAAPGIWEDFLRIRAFAMRHIYNHHVSHAETVALRNEYELNWRRRGFNFAFGAYDGTDLIGFVNGDCCDRVATIRGLYVLPECMSKHVGSTLLKSAENTGAIAARELDLVSLLKSRGFYEHNGYTPIMHGSNRYSKKIRNRVQCKTVPVFYSIPSFTRACRQISVFNKTEFNPGMINQEHTPMFAYLDVDSIPQGFAFTDDATISRAYVAPHQPTDFIAKRLHRACNAWIAAYKQINNKTNGSR